MGANILTLKAVFYDTVRRCFRSPQHIEYIWHPGIAVSDCSKGCTRDFHNPDCHCGIWASPNPEVIKEYETFKNTAYVLLNTYGWARAWSFPDHAMYAWATQSWGVKIVRVISTDIYTGGPLSAERQLSAIKISESFGVDPISWPKAKKLIQLSWARSAQKVKDPYDHTLWEALDAETE